MACIMGPIHQPATAYYGQVEIDYGTDARGVGGKADVRAAFVLEKDGTCRIDLPRLMEFAKQPVITADPGLAGTYIARAVLAALGHPVTARPEEVLPPFDQASGGAGLG